MKKALSLILLISLVITILVGCGGGSNNQNDPGNQDNVGNQNGGQTDDTGDKPSSDSSDKQVPVYQGMSISHTKVSANHTVIPGVFKNDKDNGNGNNNGNNGNHYGQHKGDSTDEDTEPDDENPFPDNSEDENIEEEVKSSLEVIGSKEEIYYSSANQNIYINIHIFNPDSFEILSFTLNGKKYSSYMFEDGSDMETIILKYNVGDVSGIVDYTIDAIKYIDGTEIKDVIIDGDKTVKAGVYKENQVTANVGNVNINTSSISFNVDVSDNDNLLEFSKGKLHAVIYDGNQILNEIELNKGENAVSFDGLQSNKVYQYAIVGHYDNLNGNGFGMNVLYKDAFVTEAVVLFDNIVIGQEYISFGFAWHKDYQGSNITSLNLYQDETAMKEQSADSRYIDGLLSGSTYYLVAEYDHDGKTESIHLEFTTFAKGIPGITLSISEATKSSIKFNINEVDDEEIGKVTKIELVHKNGTVIAENVDIREFTNILSNSDYTIRVTYSYDLNDGLGEQIVVREATAHTKTKTAPTVSIKNIATTKDSVSFEIAEIPGDVTGTIVKIELVHKNGTIVADRVDVREFKDLLSNNDYTICVTYSYDLNDGNGIQTKSATAVAHTQAKETPNVTIKDVVATKDSITFDYEITNTDVIGKVVRVELLDKGKVVRTEVDRKEFTGLLSDHIYAINVVFEYDANDGLGVVEGSKVYNVFTYPKSIPICWFAFDSSERDKNYISIEVFTTDVDGVIISTTIDIIDENNNIVASQVAENQPYYLVEIFDFVSVEGQIYTVKCTSLYDLGDGKGTQETVDIHIMSYGYPEPDITILNPKMTATSFKANYETEGFGWIKSYSFKLYKGNIEDADSLIFVAENTKPVFDNLSPMSCYTIKFVCTYDLRDGAGVRTKEILCYGFETVCQAYIRECNILNTSPVQQGEIINMKIILEGPYYNTVNSIVINGMEYKVFSREWMEDESDYGTSYVIEIVVKIVNNGQFEVGNNKLIVEKFIILDSYFTGTEYYDQMHTVTPQFNTNNFGYNNYDYVEII